MFCYNPLTRDFCSAYYIQYIQAYKCVKRLNDGHRFITIPICVLGVCGQRASTHLCFTVRRRRFPLPAGFRLDLPAVTAVDISFIIPCGCHARCPQVQDLLKCASELWTPAVDQGVERRVGVAYPIQDLEGQHDVVHLPDGRRDVEQEKRQPTERERSHDDAQGLQSFVVLHAELGPPVLHLVSLLGAKALRPYAALDAVDFLELPPGLLEDPAVHESHDDQRYVEGDDGGGDGVGGVGVEVTTVRVLQAPQRLGFI